MLFFGHVIAKCLCATGRRPFALPHRRNYVPAGHSPPNASLFSFSRGQLYSMAILHVARESTVVPEPVCGCLYIELNALDVPWLYH